MSIHPVLAGIIPSIVVGLIFWWVMRGVLRADRNERLALAEEEAYKETTEAQDDKPKR